jgi:hypothetical protein
MAILRRIVQNTKYPYTNKGKQGAHQKLDERKRNCNFSAIRHLDNLFNLIISTTILTLNILRKRLKYLNIQYKVKQHQLAARRLHT